MAANPAAVVDAEWIRAHLNDPHVAFVQVGTEQAEYDAGHLPGSVWADGYGELTAERHGVRALVPLKDEMEQNLGRLGIDETKTVVFLATGKSMWPYRGYWVLRYFRFPRVRVADRSLAALAREGIPLSTEPMRVATRVCHLGTPDPDVIAHWEDVLKVAQGDNDASILDCRTDAEFEGRPGQHAAARFGRIPRSTHLNWEVLVDDDGRIRSLDQVRSLYAAAGIDGSKPVYPYCGGGIRSAASWFVMHELLGWTSARNYDGSWAEWAVRDDLPIEAGTTEAGSSSS